MGKIVGEKIINYPEKSFSHAATAVDVVLFRIHESELQVLLLKLKEDPFIGKFALPGGLVTHRETLEKAVLRHLKNKVGVESQVYIEQLYSFGDPNRDPLGWVVSVAYIGLTSSREINLSIAERYDGAEWFSVKSLPSLAYDHENIVKTALDRLISKISYSNIVSFLMNTEFTLTELQNAYELVLGKTLDKRNFRKKMLGFMLKEVQGGKVLGSHRPAKLYSFAARELQITQSF